MAPKPQMTKEKTNGTTSNSKASAQQNKQLIKRQPAQWEKSFANHLSDTGLTSKISTEFSQLPNKKSNPI